MTTTAPLSVWKRRTAGLVATLVQVGALCSLISMYDVDGHDPFRDTVYGFYTILGLPVDASIVVALVLAVLGAALRRRKRAALNVLIAFQYVEVAYLLAWLGWRMSNWTYFRPKPRHVLSASMHPFAIAVFAAGAIAVLVLLHRLREAFPASTAPGAIRRAVMTLVAGLCGVSALGWGLAAAFAARLDGAGEQLAWTVNQVIGRVFALRGLGVHGEGPAWLSGLLGLLSAAVVGYALIQFFVSVRVRKVLTEDEELRIRELLTGMGERDSLGYFATRRDKSVLFSPNGKAALTYRVLGGTSLASADPIGDEGSWHGAVKAWLDEAARYGWVPAVLGASDRGARAYRKAGLKAFELGDEAIVDVRKFGLDGRGRRSIRQSANRLRRQGYRARIRRHGEISEAELCDLALYADRWRGSAPERGFSMALSRLGDPADARCVMVEAFDGSGALRGLLSFVPWGRGGLSLDLMRRDSDAENGVNEFLVAELVAAAGGLGVRRISLNFAMFRSVFASRENVATGPVLVVWRTVLAFFSRFFQLESLYRSNAKYVPEWEPRFLCFQRARQVPRVGIVAAMAEGFLPYWRDILEPHSGGLSEEFAVAVERIEERARQSCVVRRRVPEQVRVRREKLERMAEDGVEGYPESFTRDSTLSSVVERFAGLRAGAAIATSVRVAGRVVAKRSFGGLCFLVIRDFTGQLQLMLDAAVLGDKELRSCVRAVDLGDHIGVEGEVVTTRHGELSVLVREWAMTAKCLHPMPDKRKGLADPEARVRRRYLDLVVNPDARFMLRTRSNVIATVREFLSDNGYLEVETPMLQNVHGGANARPFVSHINAYDQDVYLRIAPELYLKRLCVAGVDRIFELNRNFRNEGADATHNPEFTRLVAYQAYADYRVMLELTMRLIKRAAVAAHGAEIARRDGVEHDLSGEWPVIAVHDAVSAALGVAISTDTPICEVRSACAGRGVDVRPDDSHGAMVLAAYERLVEPATVRPTFYIDFPFEVCPLTRRHSDQPLLAQRWDLVAFSAEIATAYSELTDPVEQRDRLVAQSIAAAGGDDEAMELDEDFLRALEYGMPPTGGMGMGMDRLLMMLTGASIRQTVPFPFVRSAS